MSGALDVALSIAAQGIPVFPCSRNKRPAIKAGHGFHDATTDINLIRYMFNQAGELVGSPTGEITGFDVLDLDYRHGAGDWEAANGWRLPATRTHRSQSGGRHYLFRHAPGVRNNASKIAAGLDVRGDGGYVIFPPSEGYTVEHDTGIADWPDWLLELVLPQPIERKVNGTNPHVEINSKRLEGFIRSVLGRVSSAGEGQKHFTVRNAALSIGGIMEQAGLSEAEAFRMLRAALPSTVEDWTLADKTILWGLSKGRDNPIELEDRPGYTAPVIQLFQPSSGEEEQEGPPSHEEQFPADSLDWDAMEAVKSRSWIYGHFLIRSFVSVLAAPGGTGKTAYSFAVALAIVLGEDILSEPVHQAGKVWLYNLEDPLDELHRRLYAAIIHYKVKREEVEGRLFLNSGRNRPLVVATVLKDGTIVASPIVPLIVAEIKRQGIDVFIVDPFIRSHRVSENVNEQIDAVAALWAQVASEANCAVLLVHHFRKGGASSDAASFRGASALIDAARAALGMATMSPEEANRLGVDDDSRWRHIRVDNAKLNLAPPPDSATWLRLVSVNLDNGSDGRPADQVQTVERWEPPSPWDGMPWSMVMRILDKISAGPSPGEFYAFSPQAKDRWAGVVLIEEACKTSGQAKAVLKRWKETGVLEDSTYASPQLKGRQTGCVKVSPIKVAEMRQQAEASQTADSE